MQVRPIIMEKYFNPGFKINPVVLIGSQTIKLFHQNPEEQAWEGFVLSGASNGDVVVVRNFDNEYIKYWYSLIPKVKIINLRKTDKGKYLTEIILENRSILNEIKRVIDKESTLIVFLPTFLEEKLSKKLGIPIHGSSKVNDMYGTKSGIRKLAQEANILMSPGYICKTYKEFSEAIHELGKKFEFVVAKHDLSLSGYFTKKIATKAPTNLDRTLDKIAGRKFTKGKDIVVVEGWIKSKVSLCAHIEIQKYKNPIICAAWQQIIDKDGISYMGAGPLMLSKKALDSFIGQVWKLAFALKEKGVTGSFGPDFLITGDNETNLEHDTSVLLELNARAPYTAYPLQLIKNIKGNIGNGFYTKHIKLKHRLSFGEIRKILETNNLLITRKSKKASGVIPHNIGLLPWKLFDIIAIGNSWEETVNIMEKIDLIFDQKHK